MCVSLFPLHCQFVTQRIATAKPRAPQKLQITCVYSRNYLVILKYIYIYIGDKEIVKINNRRIVRKKKKKKKKLSLPVC
jgi:hypothetical protein